MRAYWQRDRDHTWGLVEVQDSAGLFLALAKQIEPRHVHRDAALANLGFRRVGVWTDLKHGQWACDVEARRD